MNEPTKEITIELISGVENSCIAIDSYRFFGPKSWGGGTVVKTWKITEEDLIKSLEHIRIWPKPIPREFVQRWAKNLSPDRRLGLQGERALNHLWWREEQIIAMLAEFEHEIEKKEDEGE